jgi:hypothetical protein
LTRATRNASQPLYYEVKVPARELEGPVKVTAA